MAATLAIQLDLTRKEAEALHSLLRQIGGEGEVRLLLDDIKRALEDARVAAWRGLFEHMPPHSRLWAVGSIPRMKS